MTTLEKIIETIGDEHEVLVAAGFDQAIIGFDQTNYRVIYSMKKMIDILLEDMTLEEALEHLDYNVLNAYVGENTPIYCYDTFD